MIKKTKHIDGFYKTRNSKRPNWESDEWFFNLKIENKRKPFKAYTDLDLSRRLRRDLITQMERHQEGLPVQVANCSERLLKHLERLGITETVKKRNLTESIGEYRKFLEAKDNTEDYVSRTMKRIEKTVEGSGFDKVGDIRPSPIRNYLHDLRVSEEIGKTTYDHYVRAVKSFVNFLVDEEQLESNPLSKLKMLNAEDDIRRDRRPPTRDEFERILQAAAGCKSRRRRLRGYDRMVLYAVTAYTGLRANEMASLTPVSFDLSSVPATVTVEASISKHRKKDVVHFRSDVAELVRRFIEGKPRDKKLWPGRWFRKAAEMFRADCKVAKVDYVDEQGRYLDFHALRHGYVTTLMEVADNPKTAQDMARHSTMKLTLGYTHPGSQAVTNTVNAMPPLPDGLLKAGR